MNTIALSKYPNQEFVYISNYQNYTIRLHTFRSVLFASVKVGDKYVVKSLRVVPNGWLIPSKYKTTGGNFRFETVEDEYPEYQNFGNKCFLRFYSNDEYLEMLNG